MTLEPDRPIFERVPAGPTDEFATPADEARNERETRRQMRGSSLLLAGRLMAVGANVVTQVLIARYLAKDEYGAFAYAMSFVTLVGGLASLGFERAISRYLPIYDELHDRGRFFGTLLFVVGIIAAIGTFGFLFVYGLQGWLAGVLVGDPRAISLLVILVALAPIEALDGVMTDLFAVFSSTRAIFVRKYILAPGLRLAVVTTLVLASLDVTFLAVGYVVVGAIGLALYVTMIPGMLRRHGLLGQGGRLDIHVPLREIASYTLPLLTMDLVIVAMGSLDALLLGYFHGTGPVGAVRVVESAARMNSLVFQSFAILFVPLAARYFARGDRIGARDLYWRTAAWMAVLSFPIFTLTFSMSDTVTVLLYEERYRSSAILLALLSLGRYIDAAFGANGQTLRIFGGIRETVAVNLATVMLHVVLALVLIPPLEALGAALAVLLTYVAYNAMKQFALHRVTGIPVFDPRYASLYLAIVLVAVGLAAADSLTNLPFMIDLAMAGAASLLVLAVGRRYLRIGETFPELRRLPFGRWLG